MGQSCVSSFLNCAILNLPVLLAGLTLTREIEDRLSFIRSTFYSFKTSTRDEKKHKGGQRRSNVRNGWAPFSPVDVSL